jgi:hypothetical protein
LYFNILDKDCAQRITGNRSCFYAVTIMSSGGFRGFGQRLIVRGVQSNGALFIFPTTKMMISTPTMFIFDPFRAFELQGARHSHRLCAQPVRTSFAKLL